MTTLTTAPFAALIDRLFTDADSKDARFFTTLGSTPAVDRADYRAFYTKAKDAYLPVSRDTGRLLYIFARATQARTIVEFGTSFGISTLHLAAAVRDNGGGTVIGTEFEPGKIATARANLAEAGLADLVDIREGDAIETLATGLPDTIDLVLLDGHKPLYGAVIDLLTPWLRKGALILADNADMAPDFIARMRADPGFLSAPLTEDLELSIRL